jgi:hypothetical protein
MQWKTSGPLKGKFVIIIDGNAYLDSTEIMEIRGMMIRGVLMWKRLLTFAPLWDPLDTWQLLFFRVLRLKRQCWGAFGYVLPSKLPAKKMLPSNLQRSMDMC